MTAGVIVGLNGLEESFTAVRRAAQEKRCRVRYRSGWYTSKGGRTHRRSPSRAQGSLTSGPKSFCGTNRTVCEGSTPIWKCSSNGSAARQRTN